MVFIGYPHQRRDVPFRVLVPNLLTTIALCSGLASIHFSLKAKAALTAMELTGSRDVARLADVDRLWEKAILFIALSAVFDMLDGRAARMLRVQSPFGAMLDSLSDFLSFGVAPGLLLHQWSLSQCTIGGEKMDGLGLAAVMTFILCSGLRLARFTAAAKAVRTGPGALPPPPEPKPHPKAFHFFVGMPTPAAAGAVLIPPMLAVSTYPHTDTPDWLVVIYTFMIAGLMIGRQPMFSFKKIRIPRRWVVPCFVLVGLVVAGVVRYPLLTASLVCGAYLLTTPISIVMHRRWLNQSEPADAAVTR